MSVLWIWVKTQDVQIIMGIEEEYDIELDNESVEQIQTVGDAVEAIRTIK